MPPSSSVFQGFQKTLTPLVLSFVSSIWCTQEGCRTRERQGRAVCACVMYEGLWGGLGEAAGINERRIHFQNMSYYTEQVRMEYMR